MPRASGGAASRHLKAGAGEHYFSVSRNEAIVYASTREDLDNDLDRTREDTAMHATIPHN